jgi:imidazolonepropionase-like amidohydrolase
MTLEEAFRAVTRNAGLSLRMKNAGLIEPGVTANLLGWRFETLD